MTTDLYLHTQGTYAPSDIVLHTSAAVAAVVPVFGGPVWAANPPPRQRPQQPDRPRRVRVSYGPATITALAVITVRYSARTGNTRITTSATSAARYHRTGGPATIRHEDRGGITVRMSVPDDLEILLLLLAAAHTGGPRHEGT